MISAPAGRQPRRTVVWQVAVRIALVVPLYLPELQGGATLVVRRLAREFARRGHTPWIFSGRATATEPLGAVARGWIDGIPTWRVNTGHAFQSWTAANDRNDVGREGFAEFLRVTAPEVVHLHGLQGLGVGVIEAAGEGGVPVVATLHDWWWLCPCLFLFSPGGSACREATVGAGCTGRPPFDDERRRRLLRASLPALERIFVPAAHLAESLERGGLVAPGRLEVQPNGVERPARVLPPAGTRGGPLRVAFLGGAGNALKGLGVLLDALELLPAELSLRLDVWAADPAELAGHPALAGRVVAHPAFAPEDLDNVLENADVVVLASRIRESFSLVVREALLRGRPVITTDCGGPLEVITHERNGLVVARDSSAALAGALARLASDPALVRRLAAAPVPEITTPGEHAEAALQAYDSVCVRRRAPSVRRAAPLRLLFLSGIDGASLRYRVWTPARALAEAGVESEVLAHSDARAAAAAASCDVLILHRAPFSRVVARAVMVARQRGVPVVFSADDLVFGSADLADAPALEHLSSEVIAGYRRSVEAYARSLAASDAAIGSTEAVAEAARSMGVPAFVVRNGLDRAQIALARIARAKRSVPQAGAPRRMGFFSGTDTHDADLARVAPALARALERVPNARLVLAGPVRRPAVLDGLSSRIDCWPVVPWSELPARMAGVDVALAPLELERHFNLAKSEIKLLEAALVDVPTVASPSPPFQRASAEGALAWLAPDLPGWEEGTVRLLSDPELALHLGRSARHQVVRDYSPERTAEQSLAAINSILSAGARAGRVSPEPMPEEADETGSCVALEPGGRCYDQARLDADAVEPLADGVPIEQRWVCRGDGVWRVDLRVCTYWRSHRQTVDVSVMDEGGKRLGGRRVPAAGFVDRAFISVELERPLERSAGQTLRVRAELEGGASEPPGLWTAADDTGGLTVGGVPRPGRGLSLRSFAAAPA